MWKLLLIPFVLYAAVAAALFLFQGRLLFPAHAVDGAGPLPPGSERLAVETPGGERLHGVRFAPRGGAGGDGDRPLLLVFGGNAWNAEDAAMTLAELFPEHEVVGFHYRGYRPSEGRPSAAAMLADSLLIHDEVVRRYRPSAIVAVGFSLGTGVAARLAAERPIAGAILVTPFDSLAAVAAQHYPWIPVRLLFRHEMPAARDLARTRVPVALIGAGRDALILPERTEGLRARAANLVYHHIVPGADHNDIYGREDFRAAMHEALARLPVALGARQE